MLKTRYGEKKFEKEKSKFDVLKSKRYEELRYLVALEKKIETMKASGVPVDKVFQITIPVNFNVAHRTNPVGQRFPHGPSPCFQWYKDGPSPKTLGPWKGDPQ